MRVIGKNFVYPSTSREEEEEEEIDWEGVLNAMFDDGLSFEDDPNPYEEAPGYDATDPEFPDRRWRRRIEEITNPQPPRQPINPGERERPTLPEDAAKEIWDRECFPMVIKPTEYTQTGYRRFLDRERRERDDWDAEDEELIEVDEADWWEAVQEAWVADGENHANEEDGAVGGLDRPLELLGADLWVGRDGQLRWGDDEFGGIVHGAPRYAERGGEEGMEDN